MTDWMLAAPDLDEWKNERHRAELTETVGAVEAELLLLAKSSRTHTLCLRHDRESNRQRMAARRLVARGLLAAPNYMPGRRDLPGGGLYFYALTPRGAACWLRYPKPKNDRENIPLCDHLGCHLLADQGRASRCVKENS